MAKDIVCGNEVDMEKERYNSRYNGQEFWFDSRHCKDLFDQNPGKFVRVEVMAESEVIEAGEKAAEAGKKAGGESGRAA